MSQPLPRLNVQHWKSGQPGRRSIAETHESRRPRLCTRLAELEPPSPGIAKGSTASVNMRMPFRALPRRCQRLPERRTRAAGSLPAQPGGGSYPPDKADQRQAADSAYCRVKSRPRQTGAPMKDQLPEHPIANMGANHPSGHDLAAIQPASAPTKSMVRGL